MFWLAARERACIPLTMVTSKQLLPVYDKPMIYYPAVHADAGGDPGYSDYLHTRPTRRALRRLLGDGSQFGLKLSYKVQPSPDGLAQAFLLGEEFIGDDACAMVLGDNIFYGNGFSSIAARGRCGTAEHDDKASIFGYYVNDPERFGIVEFDAEGKVHLGGGKAQAAQEQLRHYGSVFLSQGSQRHGEGREALRPGRTGDHHAERHVFASSGALNVKLLGRGFAWLDTGTMDSLVDAADFVRMIEKRQSIKISAPEEIAYKNGWITKEKLLESRRRATARAPTAST